MIKDYEISVPITVDINFDNVLTNLIFDIKDRLEDSAVVDITEYEEIFEDLVDTTIKDFCEWTLKQYKKEG